MSNFDILNNDGAFYLKEAVSPDLCRFLTHFLLRSSTLPNNKGDVQVPNSTVVSHDPVLETLLERVWPDLEGVLGVNLSPTYAYARLYTNGDALTKHIDRDACEISMTVQLGRSHHYAWPIYAGASRFDLAEGDAVVYRGCDVEHWRNVCDGPPGYYSGQCFLHFVLEDGARAGEAGDPKSRDLWKNMFVQNRSEAMDRK